MVKNSYQINAIMGWISIITNILLAALKFAAGMISGSIAVTADGWHTLSDSLSSMVVVAGNKAAAKEPDKQHPFGHGRAEVIASMMVGFMLAMVGYHFLEQSVSRLQQQDTVDYGTIVYVAVISSIILKELLARINLHYAKKNNSSSLKADAWHHRSDSLSSVIILVGILAGSQFFWIDSLLAILVSLMIFWTAFDIVRDSAGNLMGCSPDEQTVRDIKKICANTSSYQLEPHNFQLHEYGENKQLIFHIRFPGDLVLKQAHQIATDIEQQIKKQMFLNATIHIESKS